MSKGMQKTEADKWIEDFFIIIFGILKRFFTGLWKGIKKLKKKSAFILFLLFVLMAVCLIYFYDTFYALPISAMAKNVLFILVILLPAFYLLLIGSQVNKETLHYYKIFESIGFKARDGKYPDFCSLQTDGKKQSYLFRSLIPLIEWRKNKDLLESAFDCNIMNLKSGASKNLIVMTTIPAECAIPEFINWKDAYRSPKEGVVCLGVGALQKVSFDLNRTPHVLFAGETGSGKSVLLRNCLWQMIQQSAKVIMIDFKGGVEFGKQYERYGEVITKRERALDILDCLVAENEARLTLFRELEVKNLPEYNRKTGKNLCRIGLFCDEIAEMLDKKGAAKAEKLLLEQLEGRISTLARLSRATGINLFLGIQRPDANVLTGQIKNNIPVRVSGRFADKSASEIVLGTTDATDLPDVKGRFLFKLGNELVEFQSYYFDDDTLRDLDIEVGDMLTNDLTSFTAPRKNLSKTVPAKGQKPTAGLTPDNNPAFTEWATELDALNDYDLDLTF